MDPRAYLQSAQEHADGGGCGGEREDGQKAVIVHDSEE